MVPGRLCHCIPWVSILSVVHVCPGDLATLTQRRPSEVAAGQLNEPWPTHLFREIPYMHLDDGFSTLHEHTQTHAHTRIRISQVWLPWSLAKGHVTVFAIITEILHCVRTYTFQVSLSPPLHSPLCDLEFQLLFFFCRGLWLLFPPCVAVLPPLPHQRSLWGVPLFQVLKPLKSWLWNQELLFPSTNPSPGGFSSFVTSRKLNGPSMVSTIFSTPCLLRCFTRNYKMVVLHFSCKKHTQLIYNSAPDGI